MSEIQNRYPEINLEIIDEEKLNRDEILSIDKKLNIDIHRL